MRKKGLLILQFIGESILLAFLAVILALVIVEFSLPGFNKLVGKELHIDFGNLYYWLVGIGIYFIYRFLAGSYPAFYLSSYKPVKVLKGTFKAANALVTPRKILVVLAIHICHCTYHLHHHC